MKLYDYLVVLEEGTELTVWDEEYDMESYFYNDEPDENDDWQTSMLELAKLLNVTEVKEYGVVVNLSDVIEKKLDELKEADLFRRCTTDSIMDNIEGILSGYVSEEWMKEFVNVLKR